MKFDKESFLFAAKQKCVPTEYNTVGKPFLQDNGKYCVYIENRRDPNAIHWIEEDKNGELVFDSRAFEY